MGEMGAAHSLNVSCSHRAQIQRERKVAIHSLRWRCELLLRRAMRGESREPATLGFVGIDGEGGIAASTRVRDMILAAAQRAGVPGVVEVKNQRGVDADGGLKTVGRLPGAITNAGNAFAV